jgi:Na+-driven multidrug efflux pump
MNIAISWVSTKSAPFGTLIARKEYRQLDQTFFRALWQSTAVSIVGGFTAWLGTIFLNAQNIHFSQRLLDPTSIAMLMVYMVTNVIVFAESYYLRAHKQEVFFFNSLVGAVVVTACTLSFGRYYGAKGIIVSCCIGNVVGLVWATYKFRKYRRLWHAS